MKVMDDKNASLCMHMLHIVLTSSSLPLEEGESDLIQMRVHTYVAPFLGKQIPKQASTSVHLWHYSTRVMFLSAILPAVIHTVWLTAGPKAYKSTPPSQGQYQRLQRTCDHKSDES